MTNSVTEQWGIACPACGFDDEIDIECTTSARLTVDGTDVDTSHEWTPESGASCGNCSWTGTVKDATLEKDEDHE